MKLKLLIIILLLSTITFAQTKEKENLKKATVENKDSTELVQLTKQLNDLNMNIANSKASLYDRKKQLETDEKNVDLMEINLQFIKYAIVKQKELIEAKK